MIVVVSSMLLFHAVVVDVKAVLAGSADLDPQR
jgi:hypothetical protein